MRRECEEIRGKKWSGKEFLFTSYQLFSYLCYHFSVRWYLPILGVITSIIVPSIIYFHFIIDIHLNIFLFSFHAFLVLLCVSLTLWLFSYISRFFVSTFSLRLYLLYNFKFLLILNHLQAISLASLTYAIFPSYFFLFYLYYLFIKGNHRLLLWSLL